jgi:hypothetical protein
MSTLLNDNAIKHAMHGAQSATKDKKPVDERALFVSVKRSEAALWRFR